MTSLLWLLVLSLKIQTCQCLSSSNPLNKIFKAGAKAAAASPSKADGDRLLEALQLEASTEPKLAYARSQDIPNLLTASIAPVLRAASGVFAQDYNIEFVPVDPTRYSYLPPINERQLKESGVFKPPNEPIILYEFEACPFCRKVREACSMLSLPVTIRPTPKNGRVYRPEIKDKFGYKATFPYMIDPNTGVSMFESSDIIAYLFKVYGNGQVPWTLADTQSQGSEGGASGTLSTLTAGVGVGLARLGAGGSYRTSNPPDKPVLLWAYEGSPFCKVVREQLSSLEIPHTIYYTPRGSENRQKLWERVGRFQVPFLVDPNTGVELFESRAICEYLEKVYAVVESPVEFL